MTELFHSIGPAPVPDQGGNPCQLPLRPRLLAATVEAMLGLRPLGRLYAARPDSDDGGAGQGGQNGSDGRDGGEGRGDGTASWGFLGYALEALGVRMEGRLEDNVRLERAENLAEIPRAGPLLVVANHPLGGLEELLIAHLIGRHRPDLKVLGSGLLWRVPELKDLVIRRDSGVNSHLQGGGAVLVFPAAAGRRSVQDPPWDRLVGRLVKRHQCTTVPLQVSARNSLWFYAAGRIHPKLSALLLPRQLTSVLGRGRAGGGLTLRVARPVPATELRLLSSDQAITEYLRVSTDALRHHHGSRPNSPAAGAGRQLLPGSSGMQAARAIAAMQDCRLIEHEDLDVYCSPYSRLGPVMDEIAVAREVSFRAVGEGTGRGKDSDQFDPHYLHLFLWDKHRQRIAGAYRVGLVDRIVAEQGVKGLYSRSLYKYDKAFIRQLGSAIEMGRSFIHPDYQRLPASLNLLWRGIGRILVDNPRYHTLFGSVSISRDYSDLARALIADTMLTNYRADDFDSLVKPITPHKVGKRVWSRDMLTELANMKMLGKLIGRCDPGKAVPVLLRHYLSLNGRLVCFNIHPGFNDSLEGLIIVDVRKTDPKTLNRFMGEQGARHFTNHQLPRSA